MCPDPDLGRIQYDQAADAKDLLGNDDQRGERLSKPARENTPVRPPVLTVTLMENPRSVVIDQGAEPLSAPCLLIL
jgi:hypothetical protein